MSNVKTKIFDLERPVTQSRNKYEWFATHYGLKNYRLITSGELLVRGKGLDIPIFVKEFVKNNNEVMLLANMVGNEVSSIVYRGVYEKSFINHGFGKGNFYGIGDLSPDFKYGDLIVLLEGTMDRDVCNQFITKNCLSVLTSTVSHNQARVLKCLTNKVLLLLDNDDAGNRGTQATKRKLNSLGITVYVINKSNAIKDLGDIVPLLMENKKDKAKLIIDTYRTQILLRGGKLVEDVSR